MAEGGGAAIREVEDAAGLGQAARLFAEYAASLPIDLGFQGFAAELGGLPGRYARPGGTILLAWSDAGEAIGCVAVRPLQDRRGCCEIKRLFVRPDGRGIGAGRALATAALRFAAAAGYAEVVLDTIAPMTDAIRLYRALGFEPVAAYAPSPLADQLYFSRRLPAP